MDKINCTLCGEQKSPTHHEMIGKSYSESANDLPLIQPKICEDCHDDLEMKIQSNAEKIDVGGNSLRLIDGSRILGENSKNLIDEGAPVFRNDENNFEASIHNGNLVLINGPRNLWTIHSVLKGV